MRGGGGGGSGPCEREYFTGKISSPRNIFKGIPVKPDPKANHANYATFIACGGGGVELQISF